MNELKIAVIGDIATGKTALIKRLVTNTFTDDYSPTIGGEHSSKKTKYIEEINCHLWDTTGEERFHSLCKIFYQNAFIIYLVYDITSRKSFEAIKSYWLNELKENASEEALICLVANKADLYLNQEVTEQEGRSLADSVNGHFQLVSSKNGNGVNELFEDSVRIFVDKHGLDILKKDKQILDPKPNPSPDPKKGCC